MNQCGSSDQNGVPSGVQEMDVLMIQKDVPGALRSWGRWSVNLRIFSNVLFFFSVDGPFSQMAFKYI